MAKKGSDWLDEDDLFDDDEGDVFEEEAKAPAKPSREDSRRGGRDKPEKPDRKSASKDEDDSEDGEKKQSLAARLAAGKKRPGEEEVLKSPFVLTLAAGVAILIVSAGAFWFIIGRDTVTKQMTAVDDAISEQRYNQAIKMLDEFLLNHGRDSYTEVATLKLAKTRIDEQIAGSVPDWEKGLAMLNLYIDNCRDFASYAEQYPMLAETAEKISLGALETAGKRKDRKLLDISEEAEPKIDQFSDQENLPVEVHAKIKLAREQAINAIRKYETTEDTYKEIENYLEAKRPIDALKSRRVLIDRYPDLIKDGKLAQKLEDTLESERGLVTTETIDRAASTEDRELPVPQPLTLALHTRARTEDVSEGRTVFVVAQGCCSGVDTVTGDPVWRRPIGLDTPFFPIVVDTTVPGLVMFDTVHQELILVNRLTGDFVWRQPLGEPVSGPILEHDGQLYVPTLGNHLYKIDLQSGLATTRLTFSQPVYSPPVLTRDEEHLIVSGNEAVSYTLTTRPLECRRVSFTKQKPGSMNVPMLSMGELVLMAENDQSGQALLRVLDASDSETDLPEVASVRLGSHVRDTPVLRGNRLYVPAVGEQLNVFTVSDEPDKEPLSTVARPPAQSDYNGPVHLRAGADDLFWSASDFLRQFQLTQDALLEDQKKRIYIGASAQPIQSIGRNLFVGRRLLESDAVSFTQVDGEEMSSEWRTVLGGGVLAISPARPDTSVCLTRSGDIFQISDSSIEAGGFLFRAEGTLELPEGLAAPLKATLLPDKRIAVVGGGDKPRLWIVNQAGKAGQEFPLDAAPVADPVPIAGGVVVALPTKLSVFGTQSARVEDFLGTVEKEAKVSWSSLLPHDENHIFAVDLEGKISRLQFRTTPSAHLQQVDSISIGQPLDVTPIVDEGRLFVADAGGKIQIIDVVAFEQLATTTLDAPAVGKMGLVGALLLVETSRGQLQCLKTDDKLAKAWSVDLQGDHLTGTPLLNNGQVVIATMNGKVMSINATSGEVTRSLQLDQFLEHGPINVAGKMVVTSIDGSFYWIDSILGGDQ
jgi:outer membrane protein assembly factor BamB